MSVAQSHTLLTPSPMDVVVDVDVVLLSAQKTRRELSYLMDIPHCDNVMGSVLTAGGASGHPETEHRI